MNYRRQSVAFQFEEDVFSQEAPSISKIYHEVLLIMKLLQTKSQIRNMNTNFISLREEDDEPNYTYI